MAIKAENVKWVDVSNIDLTNMTLIRVSMDNLLITS